MKKIVLLLGVVLLLAGGAALFFWKSDLKTSLVPKAEQLSPPVVDSRDIQDVLASIDIRQTLAPDPGGRPELETGQPKKSDPREEKLLRRAREYERAKDYEKARLEYVKVLERSLSSREGWHGVFRVKAEQLAAKKAEGYAKDENSRLKSMAKVYVNYYQYEQGIKLLMKLLEQDQQDIDVLSALFECYNSMGKPEKGIELYLNAIKKYPNNAKLYNKIANSYKNIKKYKQAASYYEKGAAINREDIDYYEYGNVYYHNLKDKPKAVVIFKQSVGTKREKACCGQLSNYYREENDFNNALLYAEKSESLYNIRDVFKRMKRYDEGIAYFRNYKQGEKFNADSYRYLAELCIEKGDTFAGEQVLRQAIAAHPDEYKLWEPYANLLVKSGKCGELLAFFNNYPEHKKFSWSGLKKPMLKALIEVKGIKPAMDFARDLVRRDKGWDYSHVGEFLLKEGYKREAVEFFQTQLKEDKKHLHSGSMSNLAKTLAALGRKDEACQVIAEGMRTMKPSFLTYAGDDLLDILMSAGKYEEAGKYARKLLLSTTEKEGSYSPISYWDWNGYAHYALKMNKPGEALGLLKVLMELMPGEHGYPLKAAKLCQQNGMWREAVFYYQQELELSPANAKSRYNIARILYNQGDCLAAEKQMRHMIDQGTPDELDYYYLAKYHQYAGEYDKALAAVENCLGVVFDFWDGFYMYYGYELKAELYQDIGRFDLAEKTYLEYLKAEPDDFRSLFYLAFFYQRQGRWAEADKYYVKTHELLHREKDDRAKAEWLLSKIVYVRLHLLGVEKTMESLNTDPIFTRQDKILQGRIRVGALSMGGEYEKARQAALELLKRNPDNLGLQDMAAARYSSCGLYDQALELARKISRTTPTYSIFKTMGDYHRYMGRFDQALESYAQSREKRSNYAPLYHAEALAHYARGDLDKVRDRLEEMRRMVDVESRMSSEAGILALLGEEQKAEQLWLTAFKLNPRNTGPLSSLAKLARDRGDYEQALLWVSRAAFVLPTGPNYYNTMGLIYDDMGRHETAQAQYRKALAIAPWHYWSEGNLGVSCFLGGDAAKGVRILEKVAAAHPENTIYPRKLAAIKLELGQAGEAQRILAGLESNYSYYRTVNVDLALFHLIERRDPARAMKYAEKAVSLGAGFKDAQAVYQAASLMDRNDSKAMDRLQAIRLRPGRYDRVSDGLVCSLISLAAAGKGDAAASSRWGETAMRAAPAELWIRRISALSGKVLAEKQPVRPVQPVQPVQPVREARPVKPEPPAPERAETPSPPAEPLKVALTSPPDKSRADSDSVMVTGYVLGGGDMDEISLNGMDIDLKDQRGAKAIKRNRIPAGARPFAIQSFPLTPGANFLTLKARAGNGQSARHMIRVDRVESLDSAPAVETAKARAKKWAVVIGVDNYEDEGIRDLRCAGNDAKAIFDYLASPAGGFDKRNIILLTEDSVSPTRINILDALGFLVKNASSRDTVLLYFSGHGSFEPSYIEESADGVVKYLIPQDAQSSRLFSTAVPMSVIGKMLRRLDSEKVVVLLDSCFSGSAGGKSFVADLGLKSANLSDEVLAQLTEGKGRVILSACGMNELAQEIEELKHGVFTHFLLKGLKGEADNDRDRVVTVDEAYDYVYQEVKRYTNARQHPVKKGEIQGMIALGAGE